MGPEERNLLDELIKTQESSNNRVANTMKYALIVFVVAITSFCMTIGLIIYSNNKAMTECTKLYFETSYDYGEISQDVDVKVGGVE